MIKLSITRVFIVVIATILALLCVLPNFVDTSSLSFAPSKKLHLGLDLQGGSHLLMQVDFDNYLGDQLGILSDILKKELRDAKFGYKNFVIDKNEIRFEVRSVSSIESDSASQLESIESAARLIRKLDASLVVKLPIDGVSARQISVSFDNAKLESLKSHLFDRSIEIIRKRVDEHGTLEPIIQKQGDSYIVLQVPGESDPEKLKNILGKTAKLTFHMVDESDMSSNKKYLRNDKMLISGDGGDVIIFKKPVVTGDMLIDAQVDFDDHRNPCVNFKLNDIGTRLFSKATKENVGRRLAIVLDNVILSAPVINGHIPSGSTRITGSFSIDGANQLALLLRTGALPAPLHIIEERSIGPNLGADSIESGKTAGLVGLASVMIFMVWCYGVMGLFANVALLMALLYITAMLTLFQATLTLPGIAGIILTIGMAVDANVLIYERIKEELRNGASKLYAIHQGFNTAFATIADSNITTGIAALLLYVFGVGAIRGFAVTLSIGIVASMFAAIVITKLLIDSWVRVVDPKNIF